MRHLSFVIALALCASGLLAACGLLGGQTGQEDKSETCAGGTTKIADTDDRAFGTSPREVIDALHGPLHAPLTWTKLQTTTQVTVELDYAGDAAHVYADMLDCTRRLELDVTLAIKTNDGLLDEHVPATLFVTAADSATLDVKLSLAELNGTYDAGELDGTMADASVSIAVEWSGAATHGSVHVTSASHETVATW